VVIIKDKNDKPRGYAFVEFKHKEDLKKAYKRADGRRICGRRILVDAERGRTVKNWLPRRLGGGLGSTRKAKKRRTTDDKRREKLREREARRGYGRRERRDRRERFSDERRDRRR